MDKNMLQAKSSFDNSLKILNNLITRACYELLSLINLHSISISAISHINKIQNARNQHGNKKQMEHANVLIGNMWLKKKKRLCAMKTIAELLYKHEH